jgi:hypothetical protein
MADRPLDSKMDAIANFVADKILANDTIDSEVNAAFKTLTTYWTAATKLDKVSEADEAAKSGGFAGIKNRIRAVE